jgi:Sulfate permease family
LSTRRAGATDVEADTPPESDEAHDAQPRTFVLDAPRRRHRRAYGGCRGSAESHGTVAGLSVSVGLYTAFVPLIVYALIGTSRVLSVSSTTTLAILTGA